MADAVAACSRVTLVTWEQAQIKPVRRECKSDGTGADLCWRGRQRVFNLQKLPFSRLVDYRE